MPRRPLTGATARRPRPTPLPRARDTLSAVARYEGPEFPVFVRVGQADGRIYVDLGGSAVEIWAGGWRVVERPPVRFWRPQGMLPLPHPAPGTDEDLAWIAQTFRLTAEDRHLLEGVLVSWLRPEPPYFILQVTGEPGSGKSTLSRCAVALLDPKTTPLRGAPREERELMIRARRSWLVALSNLSGVPGWLSDALCRLASGEGSAPRLYRNTLVFLAPDRTRIQDLDEAVRRYLAWESVLHDREALNLTPHQVRQAEQQKQSSDLTVKARLPETFCWLLVPVQPDPTAEVTWQQIRLQGNQGLAERASNRLLRDELLVTAFGGLRLRDELDRIPLWRGDHVAVRQLLEDFARYVYLPRLKNPSVLVGAVADGVALRTWEQDGFAYADSYDERAGRYRGLRAGQHVPLSAEAPAGLVVRPGVARRQLDEGTRQKSEEAPGKAGPGGAAGGTVTTDATAGTGAGTETPGDLRVVFRRFPGSVVLDPLRAGADAGRVQQEVIAHLAGLPGAQVRLTLEIEATVPEGVPERVVRVVTENCRTLKFTSHGFESE